MVSQARCNDFQNSRVWLPELDGLRGCASLIVVMHHFWSHSDECGLKSHLKIQQFMSHFVAANMAVMCFYVLSAFLLSYLFCKSFANCNDQGDYGKIIKRFYVRRAARIWPLYFTVLAIGIGIPLVFPFLWIGPSVIGWTLPLFVSFQANWALAFHGFVESGEIVPSFIAPLWSICVEEQFYVVFPALAILCLTSRTRAVLIIGTLVAAAVLQRSIFVWMGVSSDGPGRMYFATLSYLDSIVVGALGGYLLFSGRRGPLCNQSWLGWVLLGAIIGLGLLWSHVVWPPYGTTGPEKIVAITIYPTIGIVMTWFIFWLLSNPGSRLTRFISHRVVRCLGIVSYSVYCWHMLAGEVVRYWQFLNSPVLASNLPPILGVCYEMFVFGMYIATSLVIGFTSYYLIERPCLAIGRSDAGNQRSREEADLKQSLRGLYLGACVVAAICAALVAWTPLFPV